MEDNDGTDNNNIPRIISSLFLIPPPHTRHNEQESFVLCPWLITICTELNTVHFADDDYNSNFAFLSLVLIPPPLARVCHWVLNWLPQERFLLLLFLPEIVQ